MNEHDNEQTWKYAEKSLVWSGWGSPIGLGFFLLSVGICAVLLHYAWSLP
jgi:hypothetical protein